MSNTWRAILALTAFFSLAPQADAGVITIFNNRTLFNTLADPNVLLTFDKIESLPSQPGYAYCQVSCDFEVDDALVLATPYGCMANPYGGKVTFQYGGCLLSSQFFPFPSMTAIGFDITGTGLLSFQVDPFSYPNFGPQYQLNVTGPTFVGFISDSPFRSFIFGAAASADPVVLDNLAIRTVPEPSTISLLLGGLIVVLAASTRSRRSQTTSCL